jgi:hypothetical protein
MRFTEYSKDEYKKDILLDETGYQVMMEWEKPYMEALVQRLEPHGDVLEIGFGLGYSANEIQKYNIKSHTIIEDDPLVIKRLTEWSKEQPHPVNIVKGTWQTALKLQGKFDSIFFDDCPHPDYPDEAQVRIYQFFYNILLNHANVGCKMVWFHDRPAYWLTHPFTEYSNRQFLVEVPDNALYMPDSSKKGKVVFMPMVEFPYGTVEGVTLLVLDKNFTVGVLTNL